MKNSVGKFGQLLVPLLVLACIAPVQAQSALWNAVKHKVENKATQTVEHSFEHKHATQSNSSESAPSRPMLKMNTGGAFAAGNVLLFHDDFAGLRVGAMPKTWKTNGAASIVTLDGIPGRWLKIKGWSTLKLAKPVHLPRHFTVQFDVIAVADQVQDLDTLDFGFAHNNSVRSYISDAYNNGAITNVGLNYMNSGGGSISSSATGIHHPVNFSLDGYANTPMHVAIDVDGDNMKVYLDHTKVADSKQFLGHKPRYFYISYGLRFRHGAAFLLGNFQINGFKEIPGGKVKP